MVEEQKTHETTSAPSAAAARSAGAELSPGKLMSFIGGLAWLVAGILPGDIPYNTLMWVLCKISSSGCGGAPEAGYEFRGRVGCLLFAAVLLLISTPAVVKAMKRKRAGQ